LRVEFKSDTDVFDIVKEEKLATAGLAFWAALVLPFSLFHDSSLFTISA
jgi:hypothetical protein